MKTYELKISFKSDSSIDDKSTLPLKEQVKSYLVSIGEETFVEGVIDDIDVAEDYQNPNQADSFFDNNNFPISIYKAEKMPLSLIESKLLSNFGSNIQCQQLSFDAKIWQEGWKESFKGFKEAEFYIFPPWEKEDWQNKRSNLLPIEIEPGMAFGTGQHATTKLCVRLISDIINKKSDPSKISFLDLGCGSGILTICAAKLNIGNLEGIDIDSDAIRSSKDNSKTNSVSIDFHQGSIDSAKSKYQIIVANILAHILITLLPDINSKLVPGGELILSGITLSDKEGVLKAAERLSLTFQKMETQEDWVAIYFKKK